MNRKSSRRTSRKAIIDDEDDEEEDDQFASQKQKSKQPARGSATTSQEQHEEKYVDGVFTFTQQGEPEKSQSFPTVKDSERENLMEKMTPEQRQKIIVDTSRLVLFKALAGEPIDRLKCVKMAGLHASTRITSAVWEQVQTNLRNVFGLDLVKPPRFMVLPKKYDDRYYCVNSIPEDEEGQHSKAIHSVHNNAAIEKGLLMVILAFCFCKGIPRPGSPATMRWIADIDLYRLLHSLDDNLPEDPPSASERKVHASQSNRTVVDGITPKVDLLMEKFVALDYLLKLKVDDNPGVENTTIYSMGPRAALEVGRRQIIYFCSEILGEMPDPTMLQELDDAETQPTAATQ
jgi:hypothetical protein